MPEGGRMVAGLPAEIGFKAIGENGHAADVTGELFDSRGQQVAVFKSAHKGMGVFTLLPEAGASYSAKVPLPGGGSKNYNLPPVESAGTILHINTVRGTDSIAVTVAGVNAAGNYYLIARANGIVCYAAMVNLDNNAVKSKISVAKFPTGIVHFTLLNAAQQPLNERLIFIDHHDCLQMNIIADKAVYNSRDSVGLQLTVTDHSGRPVEGNFSVAVTDDPQVKKDSLANTMVSNLLLTSNLKGEVEQPGYYFQSTGDSTIIKQDLDNLLLTQGWVGYDWKDVFASVREPLFAAEKAFVITGRVTNAFNKPLAGTHVQLFSKKPLLLLDSVTDKDGRFMFRNIIPVDTPYFIMQARNRHGRSFNVSLLVDEFREPLFPLPAAPSIPWYVNPEGNTIDHIKQDIAAKVARDDFKGSGKLLKEVKIVSKKYIKDSQNPNGPGNADIAIDENELENAGKKNILQLLQERVQGFREGTFVLTGSNFSQKVMRDRALFKFVADNNETKEPESNMSWYFINGNAVKFIVDGVSLFKVYTTDNRSAFRDLNSYLTTHSAEDIKGLEVSIKSRYTLKYQQDDTSFMAFGQTTFIELTTRSGKGPSMPYTPGTYLYKPMPFSLPAHFYQPKYTAKKPDSAANDSRPTIYWNPVISTDKQGKAVISFYTSDSHGPFTLILEGTDTNGNIGSHRFKLNPKKE
ncbi:MAG TPA: carboxypeptidase-like regulatory domain-containing protein, partial [Mucilaginibacter sp.]